MILSLEGVHVLVEKSPVEGLPEHARVLIIDDDEAMCELLTAILKDDCTIISCSSGSAGLEILSHQEFDLVLLDIMLGDGNGMDVLRKIRQLSDKVEVVMITVLKDVRTAVEAIKLGAFDYITKHFEYDEIKCVVHKALERRHLKGENLSLKTEINQYTQIDYVEGVSAKMREINQIISRAATVSSNVLINGDPGTGKEVIARRIHNLFQVVGDEVHRPFISLNLESISDELLEQTLFGRERGSLTGMIKQHIGKFELAHGGTLFLNKIDELKPELQTKLLNVIQKHEIRRIGSKHPISVSVRLITATNQNLLAMVREGRFQADLYRCLSAIPITLPPLRERLEDIPEFVRFFIVKTAKKLGKKVSSATSKVLECLQMHFWPGNIRELENVIERVVAVAEGEFLIEEDLPIELRFLNSQSESGRVEYEEVLKRALAAFEKRFILQALDRNSWRLNKTADLMGIHRKTLEYKIKKLNLQEIIEAKRILKRQES